MLRWFYSLSDGTQLAFWVTALLLFMGGLVGLIVAFAEPGLSLEDELRQCNKVNGRMVEIRWTSTTHTGKGLRQVHHHHRWECQK